MACARRTADSARPVLRALDSTRMTSLTAQQKGKRHPCTSIVPAAFTPVRHSATTSREGASRKGTTDKRPSMPLIVLLAVCNATPCQACV